MDPIKCGKKKIKKPDPETYQHLSINDMKSHLKGLVKNVSKLNRLELCLELYKILNQKKKIVKKPTTTMKSQEITTSQSVVKPKPIKKVKASHKSNSNSPSQSTKPKLGFINYDGSNSCYIDTTITSLFHTQNKYIKSIFLRNPINPENKLYEIKTSIKNELLSLYNDLSKRNNAKCSRLRSLFASFDNQYKSTNKNIEHINWINAQQEPRDVVNMLLKVFNIPQTMKVRITTKSEKRIEKRWFNDPIIEIGELMSHRKIFLRDYFPKNIEIYDLDNNIKFKKTTEIIDANLFMVNIIRNFLNENKIKTPVIPEENINLYNKKQLACTSILIHHGLNVKGGHYTCVFKYHKDGKWYHYDDLQDEYAPIGNFNDMLKWNNGFVKKNMVACIYLHV